MFDMLIQNFYNSISKKGYLIVSYVYFRIVIYFIQSINIDHINKVRKRGSMISILSMVKMLCVIVLSMFCLILIRPLTIDVFQDVFHFIFILSYLVVCIVYIILKIRNNPKLRLDSIMEYVKEALNKTENTTFKPGMNLLVGCGILFKEEKPHIFGFYCVAFQILMFFGLFVMIFIYLASRELHLRYFKKYM